ncbi:MAG: hypothetical protein M0P59_14465 [Gallionella sp.]|jgi:hypothetical protein|nr:hypothetical protein [Gallionella sp.]
MILPPDQIQLSSFLPTQSLITKFYQLFLSANNFDKTVFVRQQVSPADGATVMIAQSDANGWLEIILGGVIATLTIDLPAFGIARDGQAVSITSTQAVTTPIFTVTDSAIIGAPTALGPLNPAKFMYSASSNTWYRQ